MNSPSRRVLAVDRQQRSQDEGSRQQQQDNGTHEFQPPVQADGAALPDDSAHTLRAYLERARQLGELPMPREPGTEPRSRPELRLAR